MAYVSDTGKRTAPTRQGKSKARVQKAPAGDVISSGGDYGTRQAKKYSSTKAFSSAVRQTFREQPPARQKEIAEAVIGRPARPARSGRIGGGPARPSQPARRAVPGPAADAIRRELVSRTGGDDLHTKRFNEIDQSVQNEIIQRLHREDTIPTGGDSKSNLELATAQSYQGQPEYGKLINQLAQQRQQRDYAASVPTLATLTDKLPSGVANFVNRTARDVGLQSAPLAAVTALTKVDKALSNVIHPGKISDETGQYPAGWKNLPGNLARQVIDAPAQSIPSAYHGVVEPILQNDPETLLKNQFQIYSDLYHHPLRTVQKDPLASALAILPATKGASNIARTAAVRTGKIPAYRPNAVFPNTGLYEVRPTARGIIGATVQTYKDRNIRAGKEPLPEMATSAPGFFSGLLKKARYNPVQIAAHRDFSSIEQIRRIDREASAELKLRTLGRKPTAGHNLLAQNIFSTIGEVRSYRDRVQQALTKNEDAFARAQKEASLRDKPREAIKKRAIIKQQKETLDYLDSFFKEKNPDDPKTKIDDLPDHAQFPYEWRQQVEQYKAGNVKIQDMLGQLYGQETRLAMRRLIPYAQQHMGATHVANGFLDTEHGLLVSSKYVSDLKKSFKINEKGISATERDDRQHKFNQRIQEVRNVWSGPDDKILTADAIRAHMRTQPGPFEQENLAFVLKAAQERHDKAQAKIDAVNQRFAKFKDSKDIPPGDRQAMFKANEELKRAKEVLSAAKEGVHIEEVPPSEAGVRKLGTAQDFSALHEASLKEHTATSEDLQTQLDRQKYLANYVKERANQYEARPDKSISSAEDILNHYGVAEDEHLTKLRQDVEQAKEMNDPRLDSLEAELAASIAEKDDMQRTTAADVERQPKQPPFTGGTIRDSEINAISDLATNHEYIVTTQENLNRARQSAESAGQFNTLYQERVRDLETTLEQLKRQQATHLQAWRDERHQGHIDQLRQTQQNAEGNVTRLTGELANARMDQASAARVLGVAKQTEEEAVKEGTVQDKRVSIKNEGLTEPAFISHAPRRSSVASYFVDPTRPQAITPGGFRGTAIEQGLADLGPDVSAQSIVRAAGLVTAGEQFSQMIRENSVRRDPRPAEHDDQGNLLVPAENGPQVATYGNKNDALAAADDFNNAHPNHQVVPVRMSLTSGQNREFLTRANNDVAVARMAQDAMKDALDGTDIQDGGQWALLPKDYQKQAVAYLHHTNPLVRMISSQFRRTVLGLSIPWMVGNISEASMRSALARIGKRSYTTGKEMMDYTRETNPELYAQIKTRAAGGAHYGLQRSVGIYTGLEHLQESAFPPEQALAHIFTAIDNNRIVGPPKRAAKLTWDTWTDWIFNKTNGTVEEQFQQAMLGRAFNDMFMNHKLQKLSKEAMHQIIDDKLDIRTIDELGKQVDIMYGKYSKFSPVLKRSIATATPFIAWYLNAVRFIYHTMPKDHPIVTSVVSNAEYASREWLKDKGLGIFLKHHVKPFLQGSVPTATGSSRVTRFTPFSVMGDPLGAFAGVVFPQFKSVILNAMGLDWKGDKLNDNDNPFVRMSHMMDTLMGSMIPLYTMGKRAANFREGESTTRHVRRTLGDPFLESQSLSQTKSNSGATRSRGGIKIPGESSGGGGSSGGGIKIP